MYAPPQHIGFWLDPQDWIEWKFRVDEPGRFSALALIAAEASGHFEVHVGDEALRNTAPTTGDYGRFVAVKSGEVGIDEAGRHTLEVRAVAEGWQPMNVKSITLEPGKQRRLSAQRCWSVDTSSRSRWGRMSRSKLGGQSSIATSWVGS